MPWGTSRPLHRRLIAGVAVSAVAIGSAGLINSGPAIAAAPLDVTATVAAAAEKVEAATSPTNKFNTSGNALVATGAASVSKTSSDAYNELSLSGTPVPVSIDLPLTPGVNATLATDGTAVFTDSSKKTHVTVQGFDGGAVRVNTVLTDAGSASVHQFKLGLPAGASLKVAPEGGVLVVVKDSSLPVPEGTSADPDDPYFGSVRPTKPSPTPTRTITPIDGNRAATSAAPVDAGGTADVATAGGDAATDEEDLPVYEPGEAEELAASVGLAEDEVPFLAIEKPWAVDAAGKQLPTRYEVQGTTLSQIVDTTGATYPVVADPLFIPIIIAITTTAARMAAPAVARAMVAQVIKEGMKQTTRNGYNTFRTFKRHHVTGKEKTHDWHHIIEQSNIKRKGYDPKTIHNKNNLIQIPRKIHQQCINRLMASKDVRIQGLTTGPYNTLRDTINRMNTWEKQHAAGILLLQYCGVKI